MSIENMYLIKNVTGQNSNDRFEACNFFHVVLKKKKYYLVSKYVKNNWLTSLIMWFGQSVAAFALPIYSERTIDRINLQIATESWPVDSLFNIIITVDLHRYGICVHCFVAVRVRQTCLRTYYTCWPCLSRSHVKCMDTFRIWSFNIFKYVVDTHFYRIIRACMQIWEKKSYELFRYLFCIVCVKKCVLNYFIISFFQDVFTFLISLWFVCMRALTFSVGLNVW